MSIIPDPPDCRQPASIRIEIYRPTMGNPHSEICGQTYACTGHADQQCQDISGAGLTPFRAALAPGRSPQCGHRFLFAAGVR